MNCIDVQRLIMPFINDELNTKQLEEFIHHVHSCPNCMEELEVHYVLLAGMKQLDEDRELSANFNQDLKDLLERSEDRIIHEKFLHIRKRIVLIILIALVAIISSFRFSEFVVEDVLDDDKKSSFLLDNVFFAENPVQFDHFITGTGPNELNGLILDNLADIYVYLITKDPESSKTMKEKFGARIWENTKVPGSIGMEFNIDEWIILNY